jgi:hypothetical protein
MISLLPVVLLAAAPWDRPQTTASPPSDPNNVPFESVENGEDSPFREKGIFIFRTPEEFQSYLKKIDDTGMKKPEVDWSQQEMIAVQAKGQSQDGKAIRVKRIHRIGHGKIQIDVVVLKPLNPTGDIRPLNLTGKTTYPYAIVLTQRFSEKLEVRVVNQ